MKRRILLASPLLLSTFAMSGCMTIIMHSDKTYRERINSVLVSADKKTLVVIGAQYHYVFNATPEILAVLSPDLHAAIAAASFQSFRVDSNNKISGILSLRLNETASAAQKSEAAKIGFKENGTNMTLDINIRGDRFNSPDKFVIGEAQRLNQEYSVEFTEEPTIIKTALKFAATPITVALDGVMFIGAVVLSPILLPLLNNKICLICR